MNKRGLVEEIFVLVLIAIIFSLSANVFLSPGDNVISGDFRNLKIIIVVFIIFLVIRIISKRKSLGKRKASKKKSK